MSEYQYYEFQAIDRPLTREQIGELRAVSTRARITSTGFVNEYNWGSFKGNPDRWMERYFDAFLYVANWGIRELMLRVPIDLQASNAVEQYESEHCFSCRRYKGYTIVSFSSEEEESYEWEEGEGWLAGLVSVRADLLRGDLRCPYLGYLLGAQSGEFGEDDEEAPVPPGLGKLSASLETLVEFLRIDPDLIAAAAEKSPQSTPEALPKRAIARWVASLPARQKDAWLVKLLEEGGAAVAAQMTHRVFRDKKRESDATSPRRERRRTVGDLLKRAGEIHEQRLRREREKCAREEARRKQQDAELRKQHLKSLVGKEPAQWKRVEQLVCTRQPGPYKQAVAVLQDLHDLADMQGSSPEFALLLDALVEKHARKGGFLKRLREAKLVG